MAEPWNPDRLLRPGAIAKAVIFDDARDLAEKLIASVDADEIGDLMQHAADDADRAHSVMYYLLCKLRGWPLDGGVSMIVRS